jgi:hypothetical protein
VCDACFTRVKAENDAAAVVALASPAAGETSALGLALASDDGSDESDADGGVVQAGAAEISTPRSRIIASPDRKWRPMTGWMK